ncbi:hypothetical protein SBA1_460006 [Candidatus Sulfotelmatobacter kueseliae]|uniref:Uncharacterized protein n=1 Tax=Candidatus Sulfotelmatobacter kueseliae TaxID=2042962 RepID=A0A2U3KS82_9BACT|nr:hypothetical protein SBA1_460006 [Candidatus Sulfotelmatobacter kueseliae]
MGGNLVFLGCISKVVGVAGHEL